MLVMYVKKTPLHFTPDALAAAPGQSAVQSRKQTNGGRAPLLGFRSNRLALYFHVGFRVYLEDHWT